MEVLMLKDRVKTFTRKLLLSPIIVLYWCLSIALLGIVGGLVSFVLYEGIIAFPKELRTIWRVVYLGSALFGVYLFWRICKGSYEGTKILFRLYKHGPEGI